MSNDDWIPVTQALPEKSGEYLVSTRRGFVTIARWGYDLYNNKSWCSKNFKNCVVAWQELPKSFVPELKVEEETCKTCEYQREPWDSQICDKCVKSGTKCNYKRKGAYTL